MRFPGSISLYPSLRMQNNIKGRRRSANQLQADVDCFRCLLDFTSAAEQTRRFPASAAAGKWAMRRALEHAVYLVMSF